MSQAVVSRVKCRCMLMMASTSEKGPWVPVQQMELLEIIGGAKTDEFELHQRNHGFTTARDPIRFRGGTAEKKVVIPNAEIRVVRIRGTNPITIHAVSYKNGHSPSA